MAVTSGFFNSIDHDRRYDADQVGRLFDGLILDGVYQNYGTAFKTSAGPGDMQVSVGVGRAWFMHTWTLNDANLTFDVPAASLVSERIDCICIEVDRRKSVRENSIVYVTGAAGGGKPVLIDEEDHKQYPLSYINLPLGATKISQSYIEYAVGSSETPIVTAPLQMLNIDNITAQFDAEFHEWFEGVRDIIDDFEVGNLMNQLHNIRIQVDANTAQIKRLINSVFKPSEGQNLGSVLTAAQKTAIENGTFTGMYPGDYWEINGTRWYIIDYDYYMRFVPHDGTPKCEKHHLVVFPLKLFKVDGAIDASIPIANKSSYETDNPYLLRLARGRASDYYRAYGEKMYLFNKAPVTISGFDWQHPASDAVDFAKSAWGENLVSVPDAFGDFSTMFQDFNWETTEGVLIPHFLDMPQSLYGDSLQLTSGVLASPPGFSLTTALGGINSTNLSNGKLGFRVVNNLSAVEAMGLPCAYQHGEVIQRINTDPLFYASSNSDCRTYLQSRFVENGGYAVNISELASDIAKQLASTVTYDISPFWKGSTYTAFQLYTRDAMVIKEERMRPTRVGNYKNLNGYAVLSDFTTKIKPALTNAGYDANTINNITPVSEPLFQFTSGGTTGGIFLVPYGTVERKGSATNYQNEQYQFRFSTNGSDYALNASNSAPDSTLSTGTPNQLRLGSYIENYDGETASYTGQMDRRLQFYYYPIVCCIG